jgi:hypothetical protein
MKMGLAWGLGILLTVILTGCSIEDMECTDLDGFYRVEKEVVGVSCQENGAPVKIDNAEEVMPDDTELQISQGSCDIFGSENLFFQNIFLTYFGDMDRDDIWTLKLVNPNKVNIPLRLRISGIKSRIECNYNGEVEWDGKVDSEGLIEGEISYDLTLRADEGNDNCPDTCQVQANFKGEKE